MGLHLGKLFGWGVAIYAIIFLLWSVFVAYGFVEGYMPRVTGLLVLVVTCIAAGRSLGARTWHDVLPYSIAWGVMMGILDAVISVPFTGWEIFLDWNVWFGYAVVVLVPLLALYPRFNKMIPRVPEA
jgi:hypothetical protein